MQIHFNSIDEPTTPGLKWQKLFERHWPAYNQWLNTKSYEYFPSLETSVSALREYMPEMIPVYNQLCELVGDNPVAQRFLTGFQPPEYMNGCSQLVLSAVNPNLIRNYDYHPSLMEGTILQTAWNGKKVMAVGDSLIGVLDGMSEDGLVVSHTFGGRRLVGVGFGIPFILRYILEFCSNVNEAVEVLCRVPSHMAYNVTVVDKSGVYKTVQLAPDITPVVTDAAYTTNHQDKIDWSENVAFNQTIERAEFLQRILSEKGMSAKSILRTFLEPPLYNTKFAEGFGTLYTAIYKPSESMMELHWPNKYIQQTFDDFQEGEYQIEYNESIAQTKSESENIRGNMHQTTTNDFTSISGRYQHYQKMLKDY
ncbi:MAG: putative choloylglycine hydrolase [Flammeovirgaceae bacterium]|jgi:predicted choloylglycine hydrolase